MRINTEVGDCSRRGLVKVYRLEVILGQGEGMERAGEEEGEE